MKYVILTVAFLSAASLNACNTFEGIGQDVSAGGEKLEKTADQNKSY